ncbi:MAG: Ig-like domain-containing protein, partial [Bdellovibrionota bacterium]
MKLLRKNFLYLSPLMLVIFSASACKQTPKNKTLIELLPFLSNSSSSKISITSQEQTRSYSNKSAHSISGKCQTGLKVTLTGDDKQETTCLDSSYSFTVQKSQDDDYTFYVQQLDADNNKSESVYLEWTRKTSIPAAPQFSEPGEAEFYSSAPSLTIVGSCENSTTVSLAGDSEQEQICESSAFHFDVSKGTDGPYYFTIKQTDLAGNNSEVTNLFWYRKTIGPPAPTISNLQTNPHYSNSSTLVIAGICERNATVSLSGSDTQSVACPTSSYSFNINKTLDGEYAFSINQMDRAGVTSTTTSISWIKDTVSPAAPIITFPITSPYFSNTSTVNIAGSCEASATVTISGSSSQTATCTAGLYNFQIDKSQDNTYTFSISQTDMAGNTSASTAQQWVRDTASPSAPTITSPAASPTYTNGTNLTISGACETASTVALAGDATDSATCADSAYSFTVTKSVDATYNFTVTQTDRASNASTSTAQQWVRDVVSPSAPTITSPASSPAYTNGSNLTISGACETAST